MDAQLQFVGTFDGFKRSQDFLRCVFVSGPANDRINVVYGGAQLCDMSADNSFEFVSSAKQPKQSDVRPCILSTLIGVLLCAAALLAPGNIFSQVVKPNSAGIIDIPRSISAEEQAALNPGALHWGTLCRGTNGKL